MSHRLVGVTTDDICDSDSDAVAKPTEQLALPGHIRSLVTEIEQWTHDVEWYRQRGIPWKRGLCLHGAPGNGKTSLVRAMAEEFDLPVFMFDLASLRNGEMVREWRRLREYAPCIAIIEDVDATFEGRKNASGLEDGLTFDCLLNCIDGVQRVDGIMLVLTTNHLDRLDPALTRKSRIDDIVELGPLDQPELCDVLVQRILLDCDDALKAHVRQQCLGRSGAEAQWLCEQAALDFRRQRQAAAAFTRFHPGDANDATTDETGATGPSVLVRSLPGDHG